MRFRFPWLAREMWTTPRGALKGRETAERALARELVETDPFKPTAARPNTEMSGTGSAVFVGGRLPSFWTAASTSHRAGWAS
jgi:hypothetical protein